MSENTRETLGAVTSILLLLVGAGFWYVGYVAPRDEFIARVTECASSSPAPQDTPEQAKAVWKTCSEQVRR